MFSLLANALRQAPITTSLLTRHSFFKAMRYSSSQKDACLTQTIAIEATGIIDLTAVDFRLKNTHWRETYPTRTTVTVPTDCAEEVMQKLKQHPAITEINGELTKRGIEVNNEARLRH